MPGRTKGKASGAVVGNEDTDGRPANPESPNAVAEPAAGPSRRTGRNWGITAALIVVAWLLVQFVIMPALSGRLPDGAVNLDVAAIEQEIQSGILEQSGLAVTVACPETMQGKPGDTRNCVVTTADGTYIKAVVTIESSNGDITWETQ